jgi:hypothetical protein
MSLGQSRSWFVYYQVATDDLPDVVRTVADCQQALRLAHPGSVASLMQRPPAEGSLRITLMEIYMPPAGLREHDAQSWWAAVDSQLVAALQGFPLGARHTEVFDPCA